MPDENKEQLIGWEANDRIPRKRTLLVKRSVSEQWNQPPSEPSRATHPVEAGQGFSLVLKAGDKF